MKLLPKLFKGVSQATAAFEDYSISILLVVMTLLICVHVFFRYILNAPIFGAEEVTTFMQIAMVFIGAAAVTRKASHITVDMLSTFVHGKRPLGIIKCIMNLMGVLFGIFYIYLALPYTLWGNSSGQVSASLGIPLWVPYGTVLIGSLLITLHYLFHFVASVRNLRGESEIKELRG